MIRPTEGPKATLATDQQLHEARQTPEGLHLILGDKQDGSEEVAHPLDVTWMMGMRKSQKVDVPLYSGLLV